MKFIKRIPLFFSFFLLLGFTPSDDNSKSIPYFTTSSIIGPFDGESDVNAHFTIVNHDVSNTYEAEFSYVNTGAIYAIQDFAISRKGTRYFADMTLPLNDRMNNGGVYFTIVYHFTLNKEEKEIRQKIKLLKMNIESIDANQYRSKAFDKKNEIFYLDGPLTYKYTESFKFEDMIDEFTTTSDNAIDLSGLYFTYSDFKFANLTGSKNLYIKDDQNIFPYMEKDANNWVHIPLKCVQSSSNYKEISIVLSKAMYVKTSTLEMSLTARDGFVETDKFYMPLNKEDILSEYRYLLRLKNCGYSKTTISLELSYFNYQKYIGLCNEATYCIKGGVKE